MGKTIRQFDDEDMDDFIDECDSSDDLDVPPTDEEIDLAEDAYLDASWEDRYDLDHLGDFGD